PSFSRAAKSLRPDHPRAQDRGRARKARQRREARRAQAARRPGAPARTCHRPVGRILHCDREAPPLPPPWTPRVRLGARSAGAEEKAGDLVAAHASRWLICTRQAISTRGQLLVGRNGPLEVVIFIARNEAEIFKHAELLLGLGRLTKHQIGFAEM